MTGYIIFHIGFHILYFISFIINKNLVRFTIPFYILLFSGLRHNVGNDFESYNYHYLERKFKFWEVAQGLLFDISHFLGGFEWYIFITSAIIIFGYSRFINTFSNNKYLSYVVFITLGYFLLGSFNHIRQYVSISLFLYSITYLVSKNNLRYLLLNIIGLGFHLSSLLAFFILPFLNKKLKITLLLPIISIGFIMSSVYFEYFLSQFYIDIYLKEGWQNGMDNNRNYFYIIFYLMVAPLGYFYFNKKNYYPLFKNMVLISIILIICAFFIFTNLPNMYFMRINNYFLPVILVLIGDLANSNQKNFKLIYVFTILILSYSYLVYSLSTKGESINLVPFQTILYS